MIFNMILCAFIVIVYLLTRLGKMNKKTKNKLFLIIVFVALFIIIASREMTVGNDTSAYLDLYKKCDLHKWEILDMNSYFE